MKKVKHSHGKIGKKIGLHSSQKADKYFGHLRIKPCYKHMPKESILRD